MPVRCTSSRAAVVAAILLLPVAVTDARAQRVEVQPFVGGRFGGSVTVEETIPGGERPVDLSTESGLTWGATVGVSIGPSLGLEFMWSRQESAIKAEPAGVPDTRLFDASISQYHGNVLIHFLEPDRRVRPYLLFGLGVTTINPDSSDIDGLNKFSFGVGGGIKMYLSEYVGLRLQGRFTPTYISSSPAIFCDIFGFCYVGDEAHYLSQGEVTAGVTIRF